MPEWPVPLVNSPLPMRSRVPRATCLARLLARTYSIISTFSAFLGVFCDPVSR
jgi:hypothetical protein